MTNELHECVKKQTAEIKSALKDNADFVIKITDNICALDFKKYANNEEWNESGSEFEISFDDAENVNVSKEDFIKYQFQYTDLALEIEDKYPDCLDDLRDAQQGAAQELLTGLQL